MFHYFQQFNIYGCRLYFSSFPSYNNFFITQNRDQFEKGIENNGSDALMKSVLSNEPRSSST